MITSSTINSSRLQQIAILALVCLILSFCQVQAEEQNTPEPDRASLISAAQEIIKATNFCALATLDESGQPNLRTMNPIPPEDDLVIWFATSRHCRKVREIQNDPRVSVYFAQHVAGTGYVTINGAATIIDDREELEKRKREYWVSSIPDWENVLVLIKVVPKELDVVNYKHQLSGDAESWRAPSISF